MMTHPSLHPLDAAEMLTARGWVVFPADRPDAAAHCQGSPRACRERRCGAQSDASKRGKHPAVVARWGQLRGPADAAQLAQWFGPREAPGRYNVAIAAGPSGLLIVDDDAGGGFERYAESIGEKVPDTFTVPTHQGAHHYFAVPVDEHGVRVPVGNAPGLLAGYGCDVRGGASPSHPDGGYVIGPGSQHWTGDPRCYLPTDWTAMAGEAPGWLITAVTTPAPGPSGRPEGMGDRTAAGASGPGRTGPGLTRWDAAPRYGSAQDLAAQFARHCAEVTEPGAAFRWSLFLAARDGWRLVNLGLLDEDTMARELEACVWRVWAAEPDARDEKIVLDEALTGPHGALASPWELSEAGKIEQARQRGAVPARRFLRPGDAVLEPVALDPTVIQPGPSGGPVNGTAAPPLTSDDANGNRTTHGSLAVTGIDAASPGLDVDLSTAEAIEDDERERGLLLAQVGIERRRRRARQILDAEGLPELAADDVDEFLDGPAQSYLIPRMLYRDGLAVIFGAPGVAKSFLALDICLSLTSGAMWMLGGEVPIVGRDGGRGVAHYVMAEGAPTNRARTRAWLHHHGVSRDAIRGRFKPFTKHIIELSDAGVSRYLPLVENDRPDIVVLDTKNLMFVGRESQGEDYGAMLRVLHRIREAAGGAAVVLIDHSGLGDPTRPRGGNAQKGGIETEIMVTDEGGIRVVSMTRDKSGTVGARVWRFRLQQIDALRTSPDQDPPAVLVPMTDDIEHRPFEVDGQWWLDETPVPDDLLALRGHGRKFALYVFRILRWVGGDAGLTRAELSSTITRHLRLDDLNAKAADPSQLGRALTVLTERGVIETSGTGTSRFVLTREYAPDEGTGQTLG